MTNRNMMIQSSNNPENPKKNYCCLKVCEAMNVAEDVRYLHTKDDVIKAFRTLFTVRSRTSKISKTKNRVCDLQENIDSFDGKALLVFVREKDCGHVILMNPAGKILVDTSPVDGKDTREIIWIYSVLELKDDKAKRTFMIRNGFQ